MIKEGMKEGRYTMTQGEEMLATLHKPQVQTETRPKIVPYHVFLNNDMFCDLCFRDGKPFKIANNHKEGCATCPTMTPEEKVRAYGPHWRQHAEFLIRQRFKEQQERR